MRNRKGFIKIADAVYFDIRFTSILFGEITPVHIEFKYHENVWYVYAVSKHFDVTEEGFFPPLYTVTIISNKIGSNSIKFNKA